MEQNFAFTVNLLGILLPFFGTALGAAAVLFLRRTPGRAASGLLMGFAAGVMTAASVWSLLLPAVEAAADMALPWLPAVVGFLLGAAVLLFCDLLLRRAERRAARLAPGSGKMLIFAVTLHNIPEGMAVGVALAGAAVDPSTSLGALALAFGIAVQNIPEGAIISLPCAATGKGKGRSFFYGVLSGAVEPAATILTLLLSGIITPLLPWFLSFAAGAMIYVVVHELIPESHPREENNALATVGAILGFSVMMLLDIALG